MKPKFNYALSGILMLQFSVVHGQEEKAHLKEMMRLDSADVNILAAYPDKVRENIFEVSTQPQAITRLADIQKKTNEDFKQLISSYSKEDQTKIWNLTRYEGLVNQLTAGGKKSKDEAEDILKSYPAEIHDDGLHFSQKHYELLVNIDKVNKNFSQTSEDILKDFPTNTRFAFQEIMKEPEAMSIMNKNMRMTVVLGDIYKRSPGLVEQEFDSLSLELARQKAKDAEEWKEEVKNNPEAAEELKKSAKDYADENGYNENDYRETDPQVIEHYHFYPYPYWCGYPWWYEYDYWYPYPYWYHWGFYYWHNDFVWIGAPSWYFIHWHFHRYHNFYEYPHITNIYINHYYGHRRGTGSNTQVVNQWVRENEKSLPRNFLRDDSQRPDRIKEYGKFEMDYVNQVMSNPKPIKRSDFMEQHAAEYPHLQPVKEEVNPKETIPVKHQQDVKGNDINPQPVIKPHGQNYPIKPKTNPFVKPPKTREQQPQSRPRIQQQQKPVTMPRQIKGDKQQPTPTDKRK